MSWLWKSKPAVQRTGGPVIGQGAKGRRAQFGPYQLDTLTEELWKEGHRIRLQSQPFRMLILLMSNPHQLVTREDIRAAIWPGEASLGFDNSINASMNKLRGAIEDSAQSPRYIETLARRGYRFVGSVEWLDGKPEANPGRMTLLARLKVAAAERKWQVILTSLVLGLLVLLLMAEARLAS